MTNPTLAGRPIRELDPQPGDVFRLVGWSHGGTSFVGKDFILSPDGSELTVNSEAASWEAIYRCETRALFVPVSRAAQPEPSAAPDVDLSPEAVEALASKNDILLRYFHGPMGRDIAGTSATLRALSAALTAAEARADSLAAELEDERRATEEEIGNRDGWERAFEAAFEVITGDAPEWSSAFHLSDAFEAIREAHAALAARADAERERAERMTLQPIETAPRDGTEVLFYFPFGHRHWACSENGFVTGFWSADDEDWFKNEADSNPLSDFDSHPTHWMPLPPEPALAPQAGEGED